MTKHHSVSLGTVGSFDDTIPHCCSTRSERWLNLASRRNTLTLLIQVYRQTLQYPCVKGFQLGRRRIQTKWSLSFALLNAQSRRRCAQRRTILSVSHVNFGFPGSQTNSPTSQFRLLNGDATDDASRRHSPVVTPDETQRKTQNKTEPLFAKRMYPLVSAL